MEESYFILKEMSEETYKKFRAKYGEEKAKILETMNDCGKDCSNLSEYYISALDFSLKLPSVWASSPVAIKEKIQKMIFPNGIVYSHEKQAFLTEKVNDVFQHIADVVSVSEENKNGQLNNISELSIQVGATGFEHLIVGILILMSIALISCQLVRYCSCGALK